MNLYTIWNKSEGASEFKLYETIEDRPGGLGIEPYTATVVDRLLKRNGGIVEVRDYAGEAVTRYTRNQAF